MADSEPDGPGKAFAPVVNQNEEISGGTQDKTADELVKGSVPPVLLTQREATGEKLQQDESIDAVRNIAKEETIKVLNDSIDVIKKQRSASDEVNALADEVVKSTIDIVKSEHQQAIQGKMSTDKVSNAGAAKTEDTDSLRAKSCTEIGDDDVFEDMYNYMEPIPDPYNKAISYLEKHNILQLFQGLTENVVYTRPTDPLEAMMEQLQLMKTSSKSDPSLTPSEQAVGNLAA